MTLHFFRVVDSHSRIFAEIQNLISRNIAQLILNILMKIKAAKTPFKHGQKNRVAIFFQSLTVNYSRVIHLKTEIFAEMQNVIPRNRVQLISWRLKCFQTVKTVKVWQLISSKLFMSSTKFLYRFKTWYLKISRNQFQNIKSVFKLLKHGSNNAIKSNRVSRRH